jgi:KaiC/GvpD/RAD55 family RecA-like ATPase
MISYQEVRSTYYLRMTKPTKTQIDTLRVGIDNLVRRFKIAEAGPAVEGALKLNPIDVQALLFIAVRNLIGALIEGLTIGLSTVAENLILPRYVEIRSQLRRLISVVKMRDSDFDSSLREFRIKSTGIELADTFDSAEAILSGFPQLKSEELPADKAARRPRGK